MALERIGSLPSFPSLYGYISQVIADRLFLAGFAVELTAFHLPVNTKGELGACRTTGRRPGRMSVQNASGYSIYTGSIAFPTEG